MIKVLRLAQQTKSRASEIIGIDDSWLAYCFDEVCMIYNDYSYDHEKYLYDYTKLTFSEDIQEGAGSNQSFINHLMEVNKYD